MPPEEATSVNCRPSSVTFNAEIVLLPAFTASKNRPPLAEISESCDSRGRGPGPGPLPCPPVENSADRVRMPSADRSIMTITLPLDSLFMTNTLPPRDLSSANPKLEQRRNKQQPATARTVRLAA